MQAAGAVTTTGVLPASLIAGEVLSLTTGTGGRVALNFSCSGTEQDPAFILGGTITGTGDAMNITGSWCIFDGTEFVDIRVSSTGDHIIYRNIEVRDQSRKNGMNIGGSNVVVTDSEIHHNQGDDRHGIQVGAGEDSVWILGNHIHHNGGDGFQACHGCSVTPPRNVYIGNNEFNSDRENGVDFKYIENVIVENNLIHSYVSAPASLEFCFDDGSLCATYSSGSDGTALLIGSDGAPTNVLVTGNEIYDSVNAVRLEEGILVTIVDNTLRDLGGRCLALDKEGFDTIFTGNTCTNATRGIFQNWRVDFSLTVEDNVFTNVTDPSIEYESRTVCQASTLVNNTFTNSGTVICGSTIATTADDINALPGASGNAVD
jgi:hypothetical protein